MSLIGTGDVRLWLNIAEEDKEPNTKISNLIDAVQKFVEKQCDREFEAKLYKTDPLYCYFDGTGNSFIFLPQYPVWYVNEVRVDADRNFSTGYDIGTSDIILYEKEGKIVSEAGYFTKGRRNVRVEYYAGYGSGSHMSHEGWGVVQFPVPNDLKQVLIEMVGQTIREGITTVHTVGVIEKKFSNMLEENSFWRNTINVYKNYASNFGQSYDLY
jgi:hypothetical protein